MQYAKEPFKCKHPKERRQYGICGDCGFSFPPTPVIPISKQADEYDMTIELLKEEQDETYYISGYLTSKRLRYQTLDLLKVFNYLKEISLPEPPAYYHFSSDVASELQEKLGGKFPSYSFVVYQV